MHRAIAPTMLRVVAPLTLALVAGSALAQNTYRANVDSSEVQSSFASGGSITPNGRFIVFTSADNLSGASGVGGKVYVRDRILGTTAWISQPDPAQGAVSPNGGSQAATGAIRTISDNGRFVIFQSSASNLVSGDNNGVEDIFVRDRDADNDGIFDEAGAGNVRTRRVSLTSSESESFGGCPNFTCTHQSYDGGISADGRYVIWESAFGFDSSEDGGGYLNIYWRDRDADNDGVYDESGGAPDAAITRLVSKRVTCVGCGPNGFSDHAVISADGKWVAFMSVDSSLIFGDNTGTEDIFVRNMFSASSSCIRMSEELDGTGPQSSEFSDYPAVSGDGRYVVFQTTMNFLVDNDPNFVWIAYRDRDTDNDGVFDEAGFESIELVSLGFNWFPLPGGSIVVLSGNCTTPGVSSDGRFVTFTSDATNFNGQPLGAVDTNGVNDVFVRDLDTGVTSRASISAADAEANGTSQNAYIDGTGRWIGFISQATNLTEFDTDDNGASNDVYARANYGQANSYCPGSIPILAGQTKTGDTFAAGREGDSTCDFGTASPDVFYSYTAECTGLVTVTVESTTMDTVVSVHTACPGTEVNQVACNDDYQPAIDRNSRTSFFATQGQTYTVRVTGYRTASGWFSVTMGQCEGCCPGNADKDAPGAVTFGDVTSVLANFGNSYGAGTGFGDADCNGGVNFTDVTTVLANYGNTCN